ncbi:putative major capsid protein [Zamilon virus]|uniref:Putative major capsid protein n=1 Tax=Zamilon virus TaxID=1411887 RepID=A0A2P1EHJ2_9VIRU|nr:putative major capsid protein [Zamilon virus]
MSNSAVPLNVVAIQEPRLELNNERTWVVVKGGQQVTYYPFPSTSFSSNQFNFICNPPSAQTVLDRLAFIQVPYDITFNVNPAHAGVTDNLLQPGRDAFRAFPISSITNTLTATINGFPVNIELGQIIHALSRYHTPLKLKNGWMSMQPSFEDNYQSYRDADATNNNPLGDFTSASGLSELPRGSYSMNVVSNTPTTARITGVLYEQVFLPPFIWDEHQAGGLANLTSLTFNWVLNNNLARIWSHSDITNDVSGNSTIGSMNVSFQQPSMYLGFVTPRLNIPIPPRITYPYFKLSRYTTQFQNTLAPNATSTYKSNIVQLDSIPRKLYVFMKQSDSVIYQNLNNQITTPDVFMQINSLNLTWNNQQGVLSGASAQNLYDFSVQNGYNKTWTEFNGLTQQLSGVSGSPTKVIGLEGGIVCLELGKDVGLRDDEAEGVLGNFNLQVQMTCTNTNQYVTVVPDMYIIAVYDGTLVISNTSAMASIGVASKEEVLNAPINHNMSYHELQTVYGGDFFSTFKNFLGKAANVAGKVNNFLKDSKVASSVLGAIPHPYAQVPGQILRNIGYGEGGVSAGGVVAGSGRRKKGGVLVGGNEYEGGRYMSKAELKKALRM